MRAERLVRRQGSSCRLSKGNRDRPLSWKRWLVASSPQKLVRLRSLRARETSLPYTMLASTKDVSALIWFRTLFLFCGHAGAERKKGMQSRWFLMRGSLGGIWSEERSVTLGLLHIRLTDMGYPPLTFDVTRNFRKPSRTHSDSNPGLCAHWASDVLR